MFKDEYYWFKIRFYKFGSKRSFWIWELVFLKLFSIFWFWIILSITFFHFCTIVRYLLGNFTIKINNKNKFSIFSGYLLLNFLIKLENSKFNKNFWKVLIVFYSIRYLLGIGYGAVKATINLYESFHDEFEWADIGNKKVKLDIIRRYVLNSFENFLTKEFIKVKPTVEKKMFFNIKNIKRVVTVIIVNEQKPILTYESDLYKWDERVVDYFGKDIKFVLYDCALDYYNLETYYVNKIKITHKTNKICFQFPLSEIIAAYGIFNCKWENLSDDVSTVKKLIIDDTIVIIDNENFDQIIRKCVQAKNVNNLCFVIESETCNLKNYEGIVCYYEVNYLYEETYLKEILKNCKIDKIL